MELEKRRMTSSVNSEEVSKLVHGIPYSFKTQEKIAQLIRKDPVFDKNEIHNLSRPERFSRAARMSKKLVELHKQYPEIPLAEFINLAQHEIDEDLPIDLHISMFLPSLETLGTKQQKDKWIPLAKNFKILGTYAQTELAHGSNLSGLETTAVFDKETDTFILNTPTLTATKWWPGNLGKSANVALVMAQLWIESANHGIQPFLIQIRDFNTHKLLEGIEAFDVGPKQGYYANDNGALRLYNVRIPRENMLMRFAQVSQDGKFTVVKGAEKIAYNTMLRIRVLIVSHSADVLSRALTIAIRYSTIRRQFLRNVDRSKDDRETPVINYPLQQWRLFPFLAVAFVNVANGQNLTLRLKDLDQRIANNDFSTLKAVHVLASCMKCVFSWFCLEGVEACRRCCGGHGYLKIAGFADLYNRHLPMITYEGENYVLLQQVTRFLVKLRGNLFEELETIASSGTLVNPMDDLRAYASLKRIIPSFCDFLLKPVQKFIWIKHRSVWEKLEVHISLWESIVKSALLNYPHHNSLEKDSIRWFTLTMLFAYLMSLKQYYQWLQSERVVLQISPTLLLLLKNGLGVLYSSWLLIERAKTSVFAFSSDILNEQQIFDIEEIFFGLLEKVQGDAVNLTDGFRHSDYLLNSSLGRYDGNVYESLYKEAKRSNLNALGEVTYPFTEFLSKL